jgi:hypothetical protein
MFSEMFQMISSLPLLVKGQGKVALKRGGYLSWAEFGEVDQFKVKHTILYFHGAPGCRFEPVMHSSSSYDKRANECISTRSLIDKNNHPQNKKTPYDNVDENSDELDVYAQRGIRLICIERPGFGDSSFLENRSVADYVDDVIEIVNSEEICLHDRSVRSNEEANERLNANDTSGNGHKSTIQMSDVNNVSTSSEIALKNESNSLVKTEEKKIYVVGYSAGGPYALAMRTLFEKKQIQYRIKNKAESESGLGSNQAGGSNVIKIAAVCVVASSVGAAENIPYTKSTEGKMLNLFFSLPLRFQSVLYSGSIGAFLGGLNTSLFCLSCVSSLINMTDFSDGKSKARNYREHKSENKSGDEKDEKIENCTEIKERKSNLETNNFEYIENLIIKITAIKNVLSHSIEAHGGRAMVTDTLAAQWGGRPWGFDLVPLDGDKLPPVLFFYSKEDQTVPPDTGVFLCEKTMGCGEPIWLGGGHSCYILHLDKILDELLKHN